MPRVAVFRSFILNHAVHHRGQLSVYLRLLDVPIPNIYGPTADTEMRLHAESSQSLEPSVRYRSAIRLRTTNATFAGRSPSRRMKYGNHSRPKGTYTRMR